MLVRYYTVVEMELTSSVASDNYTLFFRWVETLLPRLVLGLIAANLEIEHQLFFAAYILSKCHTEKLAKIIFPAQRGQAARHRFREFDAFLGNLGQIGEF